MISVYFKKIKNVIFKHNLRCWSIKIHTVSILQKKNFFRAFPEKAGAQQIRMIYFDFFQTGVDSLILQFSHLLNNVGIHNDKKRYVYKDN